MAVAVALLVTCYLALMYSADFIRHASVYIEHLPFQGNELFNCCADKQMRLCFEAQANVIGNALTFILVETLLLLLTPPLLKTQEATQCSSYIYLLSLVETDASNVVTVFARLLNFLGHPLMYSLLGKYQLV